MLVPVLAVFGIKATFASSNRGNCVIVGCYIMGWRILDFVIAMGSFGAVLVYLSLIWLNRIRGNGAAILFMTFIRNLSASCLSIIITVH